MRRLLLDAWVEMDDELRAGVARLSARQGLEPFDWMLDAVREQLERDDGVAGPNAGRPRCVICGAELPEGSRAHRRTCGPACRKRKSRGEERADDPLELSHALEDYIGLSSVTIRKA
jgi:hypothetical protein